MNRIIGSSSDLVELYPGSSIRVDAKYLLYYQSSSISNYIELIFSFSAWVKANPFKI